MVLLLWAGCATDPSSPPEWVAPVDADAVPRGDAIELGVASVDAASVRFLVDGVEAGVCDPAQPDEDCRKDDVFRWTVIFDRPGMHEVTALVVDADGSETALTRNIYASDDIPIDREDIVGDEQPEVTELDASRGSFDPVRAYHNVFGGISWQVTSTHRVHTHAGTPTGSVSAARACMNRYGASIRRWADHYNLSRASVMATAMTESNCTNPAGSSDGLSSGPMQVTASTCSALTGLSRTTCRIRMHTNPDFSFQVGAKYMGSTYQRNQHHRDPPKIAAAYNAGSVRYSSANHWHMLTTGNHIDRFVAAYNAYAAAGY